MNIFTTKTVKRITALLILSVCLNQAPVSYASVETRSIETQSGVQTRSTEADMSGMEATETEAAATPTATPTQPPYITKPYTYTTVDIGFSCTFGYHTEVIDGKTYATDVHVADTTVTGDIILPETLGGYPIYSLGRETMENGKVKFSEDNFLFNSKLKKTIKIDASACKYLEVINEYCFAESTYIIIIMPETLRLVKKNAFNNCNNMMGYTEALNTIFEGKDTTKTGFRWVSNRDTQAETFFGSKNCLYAEILDTYMEFTKSMDKYELYLDLGDDSMDKASLDGKGIQWDFIMIERSMKDLSDSWFRSCRVNVPTRPNYTFDGYYTPSGEKIIDENGYPVRNMDTTQITLDENRHFTLTAHWIPDEYDVTFDINYDADEITGEEATPVTAPPAAKISYRESFRKFENTIPAERKGYTFGGWTKKKTFVQHCYDQDAYGDTTLYAIWKPKEYTVTLKPNGADEGEEVTVTVKYSDEIWKAYGDTVYDYSKKGYKLMGYSRTPDGEVLNPKTKGLSTSHVTLYAIWKPITYEVVISDTVSNGIQRREFEVNYDESFVVDEPHNRVGYHIDHYYARSGRFINGKRVPAIDIKVGESVKNLTEYAETINIYPVWKANEYTVNFHPTGDDVTGTMDSFHAAYGDREEDGWYVCLPACAYKKTGYAMLGWSTTPVTPMSADDTVKEYKERNNLVTGKTFFRDEMQVNPTTYPKLTASGDVIDLYPVWTQKTFQLIYGGEGNELDPSFRKELLLPCGVEYKLSIPERKGYDFLGWFNEAGERVESVLVDNQDWIVVGARWKEQTYKLTAGKNVVSLEAAGYAKGSDLSAIKKSDKLPPIIVKVDEHYSIAGVEYVNAKTGKVLCQSDKFYSDSQCKVNMWADTDYCDEIIVNVKTTPKKYGIIFNKPTGCSIEGTYAKNYTYGEEYILPTSVSVPKGWEFVEWRDRNNNPITKIPAGADGIQVVQMFVKPITYTVSMYHNDGTDKVDKATYLCTSKSDINMPFLTRDGYQFKGWVDKSTGEAVTSVSSDSLRDFDLYASWEKIVRPGEAFEKEENTAEKELASAPIEGKSGYYYDQLTEVEKRIYASLLDIYVPTGDDLPTTQTYTLCSDVEMTSVNVYNAGYVIGRECSEYFWIRYFLSSNGWEKDGKYYIQVKPVESYTRSSYLADLKEYDANFNRVITELNISDQDVYTKLKMIYDYIAKNYSYRNTTYIIDATTTNETRSVGYMLNRKEGCCESYARLSKILCDYYNIPCVLVTSNTHMWNEVQVDGKWYLFDATWGDVGDKSNDWMFLVGSDNIINDVHHTIVNGDFVNYDDAGNKVYITDYACMPAPLIESSRYVYASATTPTPSIPQEVVPAPVQVSTPAPAETKPAKTVKKNLTVKKGKKKVLVKKASWKIGNKKIVKISKGRVVKGLKKGKTTVTTKVKNVTYRYTITVK